MQRRRGGGLVRSVDADKHLQRFRNELIQKLVIDCKVNIDTGPTTEQAEMMMSLVMDAMAFLMYVSHCKEAEYDHNDGILHVTWTEK